MLTDENQLTSTHKSHSLRNKHHSDSTVSFRARVRVEKASDDINWPSSSRVVKVKRDKLGQLPSQWYYFVHLES